MASRTKADNQRASLTTKDLRVPWGARYVLIVIASLAGRTGKAYFKLRRGEGRRRHARGAEAQEMTIRTFQAGDEVAQVSIYNEAAAALPKFKPASIDEVRRRLRDPEFD